MESRKKNEINNFVNKRTKQMEADIDNKRLDEEKIELMTQFMLDPTSSSTKLLEKRREMYELQEALQRDKEKFVEKEDQFKKTEEDLRNRDDEFFGKLVKYYKDTFEKKDKQNFNYKQKLRDEKALRNQLEGSIDQLMKNNEKLRSDYDKLVNIHESLRKYERFLTSVKDIHKESFPDVTEIITKYKTLDDTYKALRDEENKIRKKIEEERNKFRDTKAEYEDRIDKLIENISDIQIEIKEQKEKKKTLENEVNAFEQNSNSVGSSLQQILFSIDNIYSKCLKKKEWTKHELTKKESENKTIYEKKVETAKEMLKNINYYLADYQTILEHYKSEKK